MMIMLTARPPGPRPESLARHRGTANLKFGGQPEGPGLKSGPVLPTTSAGDCWPEGSSLKRRSLSHGGNLTAAAAGGPRFSESRESAG